nr:MAG TPA: hypothetical protein [Bacteriophage sp.]
MLQTIQNYVCLSGRGYCLFKYNEVLFACGLL